MATRVPPGFGRLPAMTPGDIPGSPLEVFEAEQDRLRALVAGRDPAALTEPPRPGAWSVVEIVRHLLFAEQKHLGRYTPSRDLNPLGLPPHNMTPRRRGQAVEWVPSLDIDEVLEAWRTEHERIRPFLDPARPEIQSTLAGTTRHLRSHTAVIERILRARR